jgi:hypothetical protein
MLILNFYVDLQNPAVMASRAEIMWSDSEDEDKHTDNRLNALRRVRAMMNSRAYMSIHEPRRQREINKLSQNITEEIKKYSFPPNIKIGDIDEIIEDINLPTTGKRKSKESFRKMQEYDAAQRKQRMEEEKRKREVLNNVEDNKSWDDRHRYSKEELAAIYRRQRDEMADYNRRVDQSEEDIRVRDQEAAATLLSLSNSYPRPDASDAGQEAAAEILRKLMKELKVKSREEDTKTLRKSESESEGSDSDDGFEPPKHKKPKTFTVKRIVGYNPYSDEYEIEWEGHPNENTMEPAENMEDDIPDMVAAFRLRQEHDQKRRR